VDKHVKEAIADCTTAMSLDTTNCSYPALRAYIKDCTSDYAGASEDYSIAISRCPGVGSLYYNRGWDKFRLNDSIGTYTDLKKSLALGDTEAGDDLKKYFSRYEITQPAASAAPVTIQPPPSVPSSEKSGLPYDPDIHYDQASTTDHAIVRYDSLITTNHQLKTEKGYAANGELVLTAYYSWNAREKRWEGKGKYETIFDTKKRAVVSISGQWDRSGHIWVNDVKTEFGFDNNGKQVSRISSHWDAAQHQWALDEALTTSYDLYGHNKNLTTYQWNAAQKCWQGKDKKYYEHDRSGRDTVYIVYEWNSIQQVWREKTKERISYIFESEYPRLTYSFTWNTASNRWQEQQKEFIAHDIHRRDSLKIIYDWDEANSQWTNGRRFEWSYDNTPGFEYVMSEWTWDNNKRRWKGVVLNGCDGANNIVKTYPWDDEKQDWIY
jgi:hypothetical protein